MKTQFENHLKQSLESYEAQYNPAHWADMEKRLDKIKTSRPSSNAGKIIGIAAGVVAVAGLVYFLSANHSENKQTEKTNLTSQNISVAKNEVKENSVQQAEEKTEVKNQSQEIKSVSNPVQQKAVAENKTVEQRNNSQKTEVPVQNIVA